MNQLPPVPAIGLTLAVPKERVEQAIDEMILRGRSLLQRKADSSAMMDQLKRQNWDWVVQTSNSLKEYFSSESVSLYFASNVYIQPSLKLDEFERDLDEFPPIVMGRLDRLNGFRKMVAVIPEPPCGDYIDALAHPRIYHAAWKAFELGQYGQAVMLAVKEIEDTISLLVSGNINATGVELVRQAFDQETGPLASLESTALESLGIADILAGFFERYKGVPGNSPFGVAQTARVLSLASYLMFTLEGIHPRKAEGAEEEAPPDQPYEFEFLKE
jgi:hypothetical protein